MSKLPYVYAVEAPGESNAIVYQDLFTDEAEAERDARWLTLQSEGVIQWRVVRYVREEGRDDEQ